MPATIRQSMTNRNLAIDHSIQRAVSGLYQLYYLYLVEHPELVAPLEDAMYKLTDARYIFRQWHIRCWETDPPQFKSIFEIDKLLVEARRDVLGNGRKCLGYFNALARLQKVSLQE